MVRDIMRFKKNLLYGAYIFFHKKPVMFVHTLVFKKFRQVTWKFTEAGTQRLINANFKRISAKLACIESLK